MLIKNKRALKRYILLEDIGAVLSMEFKILTL